MTRRELVLLLLGVCIGVAIRAGMADEIRIEALLGKCRYNLADDTNWYYKYGAFHNDIRQNAQCGQLSLLWKIDRTFGFRASYVDFGTYSLDNDYPIDEQAYIRARNSHTAVNSAIGHLSGHGGAQGVAFGPAFETSAKDVTVGAETGLAYLYNWWHVSAQGVSDWSYADGWNTTWYVGSTARWKWLEAAIRVYGNVHANGGTKINPVFTGPTSGPLVQAIVGVSVPLK